MVGHGDVDRRANTSATRDDGWVEVTIPMADERELAPILLQFGPDAVVVDPASLRTQVVARLEALLA